MHVLNYETVNSVNSISCSIVICNIETLESNEKLFEWLLKTSIIYFIFMQNKVALLHRRQIWYDMMHWCTTDKLPNFTSLLFAISDHLDDGKPEHREEVGSRFDGFFRPLSCKFVGEMFGLWNEYEWVTERLQQQENSLPPKHVLNQATRLAWFCVIVLTVLFSS